MAKIKLTKNELKVQKDALKMYRRYLPTLTLKKQQLQAEIRTIEEKAIAVREEKRNLEKDFDSWIAVFSEMNAFPKGIIKVSNIRKGFGNIAGVEIPIFEGADFARGDYDLYETPLWVDIAANHMEKAMSLDLEAEVLDEQVRLLEQELRATSQRVNLFEKVKIPETEENIKNGSYVVQRPFVLVTMVDRELSDAAFKFFNYVTSGEANEIISAAGVVPAN